MGFWGGRWGVGLRIGCGKRGGGEGEKGDDIPGAFEGVLVVHGGLFGDECGVGWGG